MYLQADLKRTVVCVVCVRVVVAAAVLGAGPGGEDCIVIGAKLVVNYDATVVNNPGADQS